ncbi:MAG TPA: VOC family protein [Blastocatellia bacterium]|nr:VOC family protein [Blastocatellia bacterium]
MVSNPPGDMPRITPHLFYDDVATAIDWLVKAFGFEVRLRMTDNQGAVVHGDLEVADSLVMVGLTSESEVRESPKTLGKISQRLYIFVDDVDAHFERARNAGATIISRPTEQFYGDRVYECMDPEGHRWKFAQHIRDVDSRTLKRPS